MLRLLTFRRSKSILATMIAATGVTTAVAADGTFVSGSSADYYQALNYLSPAFPLQWNGGEIAGGIDSTLKADALALGQNIAIQLQRDLVLGNVVLGDASRLTPTDAGSFVGLGHGNGYDRVTFDVSVGVPLVVTNSGIAAGRINSGTRGSEGLILNANEIRAQILGNEGFQVMSTSPQGGALLLSGGAPNLFSGQMTITAGAFVRLNKAQALGALGTGNETVVLAGGTLDLNAQTAGLEEVQIAGTGVNGLGALVNLGVANQNAMRRVVLTDDATIGGTGRFDVRSIQSGVGEVLDLAGHTLTKKGSNQVSIVNVPITTGNIVIDEGNFSMEAGTSFNATSTLTVNRNAVFGLWNNTNNAQTGAVIVNTGGTIAEMGSGSTTSTLSTPITFAGDGNIRMEGGTNTRLTLNGGISGGGTITFAQGASTGKRFVLAGTNTHTGTVYVNSANSTILQLATGATLSSNHIYVQEGAVLDVSAIAGGYTLASGQRISGGRTTVADDIVGGLNVGVGTFLNVGGNQGNKTLRISGPLALTGGGTLELSVGGDVISVGGTNTFSAPGAASTLVKPFVPVGAAAISAGTHALITGGAAPGATAANFGLTGGAGNYRQTFTFGITGNNLEVTVAGSAAAATYAGTAASPQWQVNGPTNWTVSGSPDVFKQLDTVTFDDTAANTNVSVVGEVNPGGIVVNSSTNQFSFGGGGTITGGGGLTKSGTSTLTMSGSHDFGGAVQINGGTIVADTIKRAGLASSLGAGANINFDGGKLTYTGATDFTDRAVVLSAGGGNVEIANAATEFSMTGIVSGTGTWTKSGAGTLKLTGVNTFAGQTIVSGGTLLVENSAALGATGAGNETVIQPGGTLDIGGRAGLDTVALAGEIIRVSGAGFGGLGAIVNNGLNRQQSAVSEMVMFGDTTIGGNQRWDIRGGAASLNAGGFKLTKVGNNEIALVNVTTANLGEIDVNEGLFRVEGTTTLNGDASKAMRVNSGGLLEFYASALTHTKRIEVNGGELRTNGAGAATAVLAAGQDLVLTTDGLINLGGGNGTPGAARTDVHLNVLARVTGAGDLIKLGGSSLRLANTANNWGGDLRIVQGFVDALDNDEVIPDTAKLIVGQAGGLNLSSFTTAPTVATTRIETVAALETVNLFDYGARVITGLTNPPAVQNTLRVLTAGTPNYAGQLSRGNNSSFTFEMAGSGEQILSGTSDNGGLGVVVTSGTLTLAKTSTYAAHAIGVGATINAGTLKLAGTGGDQIFRDSVVTINAGGTLDLNGRSEGFAGLAGGVSSAQVINNAANASTLFLGDNDTGSGTFGGNFAAGLGVLKVVKIGNATQTLNGGSTYTGTGPIEVRGGTLAVDLANLGSGTNLLNPASRLTVGGGTFSLIGKAGEPSSQTVAGTTINGAATIAVNNNGNAASLDLGALDGFGTVNFTSTGGGTTDIRTSTGTAGSVLTLGGVAFATFNGNDWAAKDGTNTSVVGFSNYTNDGWLAGNHTTVTSSSTQTAATTDTLRFNSAGAFTVTLDGANVLTSGGILVGSGVGASVSAIAGAGTLTSLANEVAVIQNNSGGALNVTAKLVDNGTNPLTVTKSGAGTLSFNADQAFTGELRILGGTVDQNGRERLSNGVNLVMGNGGVYTLNHNIQTVASLSSNDYNAATGASRNGTINLGSGQLIVGGDNSSTTSSSKISGGALGLGTLVKDGTGTLTLTGADDNGSMNLTVREGQVTLNKLAGRIANVSNILPGATVKLEGQSGDQIYGGGRGFGVTNSGGTFDLNGRSETTGVLYGSGTVTNSLPNTLSRLTVGETNNPGYFTGTLTEAAGAVTGITKIGNGIQFLTGNSTFTGSLQIDAGRVAVPTIANAGVASPIGAGTGGSVNVILNGGALTYTGTSSIATDRNFDVRANNGSIEVLDAAATLTLNGQITGGDVRLNKRGAGTLTIKSPYTNQWSGTNANLVIQGGTLILDHADVLGNNRSDLSNTGMFNNGMGLGLEGGNVIVKSKPGTLATSQTFARSSVANGWTTLTGDSSPGTGLLTIELNTIALANAGSALNLVKPANGNIRYVNNNENGITSPRVTFGGTTWAVGQASGTGNANIAGLSTFANDNYATATNHVNVTADATFAAAAQVATLRFNQAIAGGVLGLDAQTLSLTNGTTSNLGGILVTGNVGANNLTLNGGNLQGGTGTTELIVHQLNTAGSFEIGALIQNNAATALGVTKAGNGKLILSGTNTFTGNMRIGGGVVEVATIAPKATPQPLGQGDLSIQGGTLRYTGASATTDKLINLHSAGAIIDVANAATTLIFSNNGWGVDGTSHMGNLTKAGPGTLEITGNAATYTGFTFVNEGVLSLNPTASGSPINAASSGIVVNNGGTLRFQKGDVFGNHQTLTQPPVMVKEGGTVTNAGFYNNLSLLVLSGGTLTSVGGSNAQYPSWGLRGQVTVDGNVTSIITGAGANHGAFVYNTQFNVGDGAAAVDLLVSTPLMDGRDGSAARASGFTKDGAGVMELASGVTHNLNGFIEVVEGTLEVNGTISGASTMNVVDGATLTGTGVIGNLVLDGGTLSPGASPGVLSTGNTTFNGGAFAVELNGLVAGSEYDQLNVTGSVKLTGATALTLSLGFAPALDSTFTLVNNDGIDPMSGGGYFTYGGNPLFDGAQFGGDLLGGDLSFRIDYDGGIAGGDNEFVLTVVPEPSSAVLLLGGLGSMLAVRRRRRA